MCFNVRYGSANDLDNRWELRKDLLVQTIVSADPDILGVQEAEAGQADELRERLRGYGFVGAGRADGKRRGEFCALYFKTDRLEPLAEGHFWLSPTPDVPGSKGWDADLPRMASWARLKDAEAGGEPVLVLNTHWDYVGSVARRESARLIRRKIRELNGGPAVVMGDLNTTEDTESFEALTRAVDTDEGEGAGQSDLALLDSYRQCHPDRTTEEATYHGFSGGVHGSRIDFILHTPDLKAVGAEIDRRRGAGGRYPSDHYPILGLFERRPAES